MASSSHRLISTQRWPVAVPLSAGDGGPALLALDLTSARRQLAERLPGAVAFAAHEFVVGPLLDAPWRVGKRLHAPLDDRQVARRGTYRVIYVIDGARRVVTVVDVAHRRDAYRVT